MQEDFEKLFKLFKGKKYKDIISLLENKTEDQTSRSLNIFQRLLIF